MISLRRADAFQRDFLIFHKVLLNFDEPTRKKQTKWVVYNKDFKKLFGNIWNNRAVEFYYER